MWKPVNIQPGSFIETDRVNNERVAFPFPDGHTEPRAAGIIEVLTRRQLPAIHPDLPRHTGSLKELQDSSGRHDPLGCFRV
jgi:hypothetical protein